MVTPAHNRARWLKFLLWSPWLFCFVFVAVSQSALLFIPRAELGWYQVRPAHVCFFLFWYSIILPVLLSVSSGNFESVVLLWIVTDLGKLFLIYLLWPAATWSLLAITATIIIIITRFYSGIMYSQVICKQTNKVKNIKVFFDCSPETSEAEILACETG